MTEPTSSLIYSLAAAVGGAVVTAFGVTPQTVAIALVAAMLAALLGPAPDPTLGARAKLVAVVLGSVVIAAVAGVGLAALFSQPAPVANLIAGAVGFGGPAAWRAWIEKAVDKIAR